MSSIIVSHYRDALVELLSKFGFYESNLQIVQDIRKYCQSIGHPHLEDSDRRLGKCVLADGKTPIFLLRDEITDDLQSECKVPIIARNFQRGEIDKLDEPRALVQHLLLHEIAHHLRKELHSKLGLGEVEQDCDAWAFDQLRRLTMHPADVPPEAAPGG